MSQIDAASIGRKVFDWSTSQRGQSKMRATVKDYIRKDKRVTDAGSEVLTRAAMEELGSELVRMIMWSASASGLPASVQNNVNSLQRGAVKMYADGSMSCELTFTDDLSRPSLEPEWSYKGESTIRGGYSGVKNIIAIFNNGYEGANPHVWGIWHGEIWHAKASREGLHFIEEAIREFESKYGARYGVQVVILGPY